MSTPSPPRDVLTTPVLWDIGEYEITDSRRSVGSDSEDERRKKRRKVSPEAEDP